MYRALSILFTLFLCSSGLLSQSRGFISYSVQDGLAQSNVIDIAEDPLGNLWLATSGGLSKFNGIDFETYKKQDGLDSNLIFCVGVDLRGNIWVGTNLGITSYDGKEFRSYRNLSLGPNDWVSKILPDKAGNIWFATTSGDLSVLQLDEENHQIRSFKETIKGTVSGLVETDAAIWIATYKQGLYKYTEHEIKQIPLGADLENTKITALYADQQERIWIGTSRGLYVMENGVIEYKHSFHADSHDLEIYSISEENSGTIWVGTISGAFRYHQGLCNSIKASDGLTDNIVYKIHKDREGTLWFGSFGGGVFKSLGELFTRVGKEQGLGHDYISCILQGESRDYWFGSYGGGLYHYVPADGPGSVYKVQHFASEQGLSNDFVYDLAWDNDGDLWIASELGLNVLRQGKISSYKKQDGLPSNQIFSVLKCSDGSLFCGSAMGLTKIIQGRKPQFINYNYHGEQTNNRVRTLVESKTGDLLLGTHGGLKVFDGKTIKDYFQIDSLRHRPVSTIYEDHQGGVWCALLDEGILYYRPGNENMIHITEEQGLSSNIVYSLSMDKQGALWVGTPHGLDKINFKEQGKIERVRHFAADDGFFGIETNTNAIHNENDGSIWFGTVAGAFKCVPENDRFNTLEPITYITGIRLFSQEVDWIALSDSSYGWYNLPINLSLSHNQNHLTFDFFGNSLRNPNKVAYQYTLQNFDRDWQPVTKNNEAVYTNLPPGKYTFKVKASNNDGVWNQKTASISFEITPPFWSTWWFFTFLLVVLGIASRLYYNFRVQKKLRTLIHVEKLKIEEITKVRRRVAEDFHDQVGNQLASITVLVQLIQAKLSSGNKEVDELLQKLGQFTKTLFTGTRDFIWSIDPKSDNVNEMLIYIRDFGEELFEYSEVNFHVETNDALDAKLKLPVGWSRHVVYIFKEALTNSLKHANCKNVYLNFNVSDYNFVFELRDDGVGLNGYQDGEYLGMGLQNMKERARKIGGEIAISSGVGVGTTVVLEGKIPQNKG